MKKILIIDESELYREFLSSKLMSYGMDVTIAQNGLDGSIKMRQESWDLVIMEFYLSRASCIDLLERKAKDPNLKNIPVIIASSKINRDNIIKLSLLGVKKIFNKPIRIDALMATIGELLGLKLELDNTPCIIEANLNDDIFFIEVARGLNPDKIELLKFRLKELVELYRQARPKVLLIMSGLELNANDSLAFNSLIGAILDFTHVGQKNFKILANNEMVNSFLKQKGNFSDIEVVPNLEVAMDRLASHSNDMANETDAFKTADMLSRPSQSGNQSGSELNMHFDQEVRQAKESYFNVSLLDENTSVAIVDDDPVIRQIIKKAFSTSNIHVSLYKDGEEFLADDPSRHDLVFLDIMMPRIDGFKVLELLGVQKITVPVIILSALSKKETVIKAMKYGVKSYAIKPIQPEEIQKKALEILRMNF